MTDRITRETALPQVAVLSAYRERFDRWVIENGKEGEIYICVMKVQDANGRVFSRVEKTFGWYGMKEAEIVEKYAMSKIRSPLPPTRS